jgi:hypothetical protein
MLIAPMTLIVGKTQSAFALPQPKPSAYQSEIAGRIAIVIQGNIVIALHQVVGTASTIAQ